MKHWSQVFLKHPISSVTLLSGGLQHQLELIKLNDESLWVCKTFESNNWLEDINYQQLELAESFASQVAKDLGFSFVSFGPFLISEEPYQPLLPQLENKSRENKSSLIHTKLKSNRSMVLPNSLLGIIYPFCEGKVIDSINDNQAYLLGKMLAKLHIWSSRTKDKLVMKMLKLAKPFPLIPLLKGVKFGSRYPEIKKLINECNKVLLKGDKNWILSHRDLNLTNIIWQGHSKFYVIDWESTGLIHPLVELIGLALNCAGIPELTFNEKLFQATLEGYRAQTSTNYDLELDILLIQSLHTWLLWFVYCLSKGWTDRALDCDAAIQKIQSNIQIIKKTFQVCFQVS